MRILFFAFLGLALLAGSLVLLAGGPFGCAKHVHVSVPQAEASWRMSADGTYAYFLDRQGNVYLVTKQSGAVSRAAKDLGVVGGVENVGQLYFIEKAN